MVETVIKSQSGGSLGEHAWRVLHEIDTSILKAHSSKAGAQAVLDNITLLLPGCEWACVTLFDKKIKQANILAIRSENLDTFSDGDELPLEDFRAFRNLESPSLLHINDLSQLDSPTPAEQVLVKQGLRSFLSVPMIVRSQMIGVLALSSSKTDLYTDGFAEIAREISDSLAVAIENKRLVEAERERNRDRERELMATTLVATALRMAETRAAIPFVILDQLLILFQAKGALLAQYKAEENRSEIELGLGSWEKITGEHIPSDAGILSSTITSKHHYLSNDALHDATLWRPDLLGNISSVAFIPLIAQGDVIGVLGIGRQHEITKDDIHLLTAIADMIANAMHNLMLMEDLQHSHDELADAYDSTLEGWARALELRDYETKGHTERVSKWTVQLARSMGISGDEIDYLHRGAILHDIGKMGISDNILLKPGKLTEDEWTTMRLHPRYAYDMLLPINFLSQSLDIPYCHHEKWDGSGYPRQLKGTQIPLSARIFAIVDVYDALTSSGRSYRDAWTQDQTIDYIREQSGSHFDPQVVEAFLKMAEEGM